MKFHLAINMERIAPGIDMREVERHTLEMVRMADAGGFHIVWAAEHHALEMTIAPNPFQILTWWAAHTENIRLGSAVAVAPYWHPVNLAGEAALLDLYSGGRLEFGIGSGAYQREFDRMRPGLKQSDGWRYMQEMLPVLKALWRGDTEHAGEFWQFPKATSVPKPLQQPHPPLWVAARAPVSFDYAVENDCNIMSWPLTRPMSEAEAYRARLDDACKKFPKARPPVFAMMRHTAVYAKRRDWEAPVKAAQRQLSQFENLFKNLGDVEQGFPKAIAFAELANRGEYDPKMLHENLMFGVPDEVVAKLKLYEALGVDAFIYYASLGLGQAEQKRSLELFCREVMPAFA
ncbi:MAG: LLM class flavin-dependent oxidoreductase [Gammaproteobacteria bacterium]